MYKVKWQDGSTNYVFKSESLNIELVRTSAQEAKRKADLRKAKLNPQPTIPGGMTKEQFAAQYAKMFKQPATNQKEPYKFPETMEEQRAKCDEANELKRRGIDYGLLDQPHQLYRVPKALVHAMHQQLDALRTTGAATAAVSRLWA